MSDEETTPCEDCDTLEKANEKLVEENQELRDRIEYLEDKLDEVGRCAVFDS